MKRILTLLLVLALAVAALASCDAVKNLFPGEEEEVVCTEHVDADANLVCDNCGAELEAPAPEVDEGLQSAYDYLHQMCKELDQTYASYELVKAVKIGVDTYTVEWSIDIEAVYLTDSENGATKVVNVPELKEGEPAIPYVLKFVVSNDAGEKLERSYNLTVPEFKYTSFEEYMKAKEGDIVSVKGTVVAINSISQGNKYNHVFLMDAETLGGYYCYKLTKDPVADLGIELGMTVSVTGTITPFNNMQEIKDGDAKILSSEKVDFSYIDITEKWVKGTDFNQLVSLPVTIKGVTIGGQDLEKDTSQYLYFELNGVQGYVRTYVTDFPAPLTPNDKATIDALHASKLGYTADVTGILITYSGAPYLIPTSVDCFYNFQLPERSDDEKLELEIGNVSLPTSIGKNTTLELPLAGSTYDNVKFSWSVDDTTLTIGEDGKVAITLGSNEKTLTFTLTATIGEGEAAVSKTQNYTVAVAAGFVMNTVSPYIPSINQVNLNKVIYLDGGVDGRYLTTTEDASKAVKVYAEKADGGYKFYILVEDAKQYIYVYNNDESKSSVKYDAENASVFTYNSIVNAFATTLGTSDVYLGTYKTFATISVSDLSYINADNTGVSQFPLELLKVVNGGEHIGSVNQVNLNKVLYLDGGVDGRYLTTTEDASKAVKVYAEKVEGGYKFYILVEDAKQYIYVYNNDESKSSVKYDAENASVFAYNATVNAWATVLGTSDVYIGTYKTFGTISVSDLSYINADNTGVSQFTVVFDVLVATGDDNTGDDNTGDEGGNEGDTTVVYTKVTELKTGDLIVIAVDAYGKALSATKVSTYYNAGIDFTANNSSNITDAEIWEVTKNDDGTYTFTSLSGTVLAMAASNNSLNADGEHTTWNLETKEGADGIFYLKNSGRGTYLEWYASKSNWSTYNGTLSDLFELSFYVKSEGGEVTPPAGDGDDNTDTPAGDGDDSAAAYVKVTTADQFTSGTYVLMAGKYAATTVSSANSPWLQNVATIEVVDGKIVDAKGAIITVVIDGSTATLKDANGKYIAPKGGNTNGIKASDSAYNWNYSIAEDGTITFTGVGDDTVTLAYNQGNNGGNFRAYKNATVSGKYASDYITGFAAYKYNQ